MLLDIQGEKIIHRCNKCRIGLYQGEEVLLYDKDYYCSTECMLELIDYEGVVL